MVARRSGVSAAARLPHPRQQLRQVLFRIADGEATCSHGRLPASNVFTNS